MKPILQFLSSISFLLLTGCATVNHQIPSSQLQSKVRQLTESISQLGPNVLPQEALKVAKISVYYPLKLSQEYKLVESPILHNILVNSGMRERGLCIHWTEDLIRKLSVLKLTSLKFYWGVANREANFRMEHSAVIVTPSELDLEDGIVLDAWRNSGELHYSPVLTDSYEWKKHYNDVTAELAH
ncbi:hypothetical protein [Kangiella sp. HZ709]|uniref:hypothetical protein n=1 Tax=Kangiella sp. HZ709 TaxID=2666328 RepID=UPI0012B10CDC|nr:hypothetical protein [Kangiella sp. HZ709]MRX26941.1 hypothetical protein [Kangiella sp. HZ709]